MSDLVIRNKAQANLYDCITKFEYLTSVTVKKAFNTLSALPRHVVLKGRRSCTVKFKQQSFLQIENEYYNSDIRPKTCHANLVNTQAPHCKREDVEYIESAYLGPRS